MREGPVVVRSPNLAYAWAKVFTLTMEAGSQELPQLIVRIGPEPEDTKVREILDTYLMGKGGKKKQRCQTVAQTVFPFRLLWRAGTRTDLFARYERLLPQIKKCPANRRGTYFERMIAFSPDAGPESPKVQQLEKVITDLRSPRARRTGLQLGIFDPTRDHTDRPYMGFPCLQQVAFSKGPGDGLNVSAFYPLHYLYERAYGNYLGLVELGRFVAEEAGLRFAGLTCIAEAGRREITKKDSKELNAELLTYIESLGGFPVLRTEEAEF